MSIVPAQPGADAPAGARTRILGLQTRSSNRLRYWCVFFIEQLGNYSIILECNNGTRSVSTRRSRGFVDRVSRPPSGWTGFAVADLSDFVGGVVGVWARRRGVLDATGAAEGPTVIGDLCIWGAGGFGQMRPGCGCGLQELEYPRSGRMPERSHLLGWHEFSSEHLM